MNHDNYIKLRLGLSNLKKDEEKNIITSVKENYNIRDITFYNPTFLFIHNTICKNHIFNNRFKLYKLLKKSSRCSINGFEYFGLIKKKW